MMCRRCANIALAEQVDFTYTKEDPAKMRAAKQSGARGHKTLGYMQKKEVAIEQPPSDYGHFVGDNFLITVGLSTS